MAEGGFKMVNFLTVLINVFTVWIFPFTFTVSIFQDMKTKEGIRKIRLANLIGVTLASIISLLILFVPGVDIFFESIARTWIGSLWNIYRFHGIIALILINTFFNL